MLYVVCSALYSSMLHAIPDSTFIFVERFEDEAEDASCGHALFIVLI